MSNTDAHPSEILCRGGGCADAISAAAGYVPVEIITARDVPLGGPRAMNVRRTLPQRKRSLIGAWCFADHYGPDDVSRTGGMDVAPHPHTGLQTVSWLFEGSIAHIDSGGNSGTVLPGEVNLMTAGAGICHSETSTKDVSTLHGVQLWVALPESARTTAPRAFEHYTPPVTDLDGGSAVVFLGDLAGCHSPVETFTPLLGAELRIDPHAEITVEVQESFEHGLLVDAGNITLEGVSIPRAGIGYTGVGAHTLHIRNDSDDPARAILLGGEPFAEDIVIWWNFVGRSSEEIAEYRKQWQQRTERFGQVEGYVGHGGPDQNADGMSWLPAPRLPNGIIKARKNPSPEARPDLPEPGSSSSLR